MGELRKSESIPLITNTLLDMESKIKIAKNWWSGLGAIERFRLLKKYECKYYTDKNCLYMYTHELDLPTK